MKRLKPRMSFANFYKFEFSLSWLCAYHYSLFSLISVILLGRIKAPLCNWLLRISPVSAVDKAIKLFLDSWFQESVDYSGNSTNCEERALMAKTVILMSIDHTCHRQYPTSPNDISIERFRTSNLRFRMRYKSWITYYWLARKSIIRYCESLIKRKLCRV